MVGMRRERVRGPTRRLHRVGPDRSHLGVRVRSMGPAPTMGPDSLNDPLGTYASGLGIRLRLAGRATTDVQFDGAEGPLMALNRHAQGGQQPLGRIEVHDDA